MSVLHIKFEDSTEGVMVKFTSNRPLPTDVTQWTPAETIAKQTADAIDTLMELMNEIPSR